MYLEIPFNSVKITVACKWRSGHANMCWTCVEHACFSVKIVRYIWDHQCWFYNEPKHACFDVKSVFCLGMAWNLFHNGPLSLFKAITCQTWSIFMSLRQWSGRFSVETTFSSLSNITINAALWISLYCTSFFFDSYFPMQVWSTDGAFVWQNCKLTVYTVT